MEITIRIEGLDELTAALIAHNVALRQLAEAVAGGKVSKIYEVSPATVEVRQDVTPQQVAEAIQTQTGAPTAVPTTPAATTQQATVTPAAAVPTTPTAQAPAAAVQTAPTPTAVPTSAPSYTLDQLAVAATQIMDAGRRTELVGLLQSFGVQALTALPKEQYGAFATKLRELGAKI